MGIVNLTAWQLLAWIVGLEIVSAPIIIVVVNSVISGYFRYKEQHVGRMAKAIGEAMEKTIKTIENKVKKEEEN